MIYLIPWEMFENVKPLFFDLATVHCFPLFPLRMLQKYNDLFCFFSRDNSSFRNTDVFVR